MSKNLNCDIKTLPRLHLVFLHGCNASSRTLRLPDCFIHHTAVYHTAVAINVSKYINDGIKCQT